MFQVNYPTQNRLVPSSYFWKISKKTDRFNGNNLLGNSLWNDAF